MREARLARITALSIAGLLTAGASAAQPVPDAVTAPPAPDVVATPPALDGVVAPPAPLPSALLPVTAPPFEAPPLPPLPPPKPARHWYGWQILAPVGVGDTLFWIGTVAGGKNAGALMGAGALTHMLSGTVIHLAHRQWAKAGASLGLNVAAPLALGTIGLGLGYVASMTAAGSKGGDSVFWAGPIVGGAIGVFSGGMAATVLDAMALAYEPADVRPTRAAGATFSLIPMIGPGRMGLGVGGQL